ncbi:MAG: 50S ribosomal protein L18 [Thermodesulfobacteriota bacterium]
MGYSNQKKEARLKRKKSIRKKISGTSDRPRLSVFRSARHIYAQVVDDSSGQTLAAASSLEKEAREQSDPGNKTKKAAHIGTLVAKRALERGIISVVFDRNGFLYHGRVKAVSDAAREAGLKF